MNESTEAGCPDIRPVDDLDLHEYVRKSWYTILQQYVLQWEPIECAVATFTMAGPLQKIWNVPHFYGSTILMDFYEKGVWYRDCGSSLWPDQPSRLKVAPCFLPAFLGWPRWVIHVEKEPNGEYAWVIVSSGPPNRKFRDGCTTWSGLWVLSRSPSPTEGEVAKAKGILKSLGYTTRLLKKVKQEGCDYKGANIK